MCAWSVPDCFQAKRRRLEKEQSSNGCCVPQEKMHHDHVDKLVAMLRKAMQGTGKQQGLFKADIDSAFRRVPIDVEHTWAYGVAFLHDGIVWTSVHTSSPLGAVASVHAWERIGALVAHIARKCLKLVLARYVDDYFGCESLETLEHALSCFARLVRLLLGESALAEKKLDFGSNLEVLGIEMQVSWENYFCRPSAIKKRKWLLMIRKALASGVLRGGEASKLAGKLQWACQHMFNRVGRAMLRALYNQIHNPSGRTSPELVVALRWWEAILELDMVECRSLHLPNKAPVHLFCDAAGAPARVAAVLWVDGRVLYTDCAPPEAVVRHWKVREDQQIMGLELLSIALGLSSFEQFLMGRCVVIHSDNTGAECCFRKGAAKEFDHCSLIHNMWTQIARCHMNVWVCRVGTDDNIADLPSRFEYSALRFAGAQFVEPGFHESYESADAWAEFVRKCGRVAT